MSLAFLHGRAVMLIRLALGLVFVWMGVLKLFNVSPMQDILNNAIPSLGESQLLLFAAAFFEILIGAAFLANKFVKFAAVIMSIHLFILTFAVLFTQGFAPRFPVLSLAGEHALKNLVLIAAGLLLLSEEHEKPHHASHEKAEHPHVSS
jgi:putative oxidoreductase